MTVPAFVAMARRRRFLPLAWAALGGIRREQLRAAIGFGLLVTVVTAISFAVPLVSFASSSRLSLLLSSLLADAIRALALLAAIVIADRAVEEGAPRRAAYVAAALGGCLLGAVVAEPLLAAWRAWIAPAASPASRPWLHGRAGLLFYPLFDFTHWLLIGGAGVFLYADRRAAHQTEARLRAAEVDRSRHARLALESRLQALQARVEPRFLFNTLALVERLFERDAALAGRMLDDLIAYLRAAMPRMRDTSSTVGQEVDLARAYLDIVGLRAGGRVTVTLDVPPDARALRMPPMLLLPLIDHAAAQDPVPAAAGASVHVMVIADGTRLRLTLIDRGARIVSRVDAEAVAVIRQRLAALFAGDATLDIGLAGESATQAILDLPLQSVQDASSPLTSRNRVGAAKGSGSAMPNPCA